MCVAHKVKFQRAQGTDATNEGENSKYLHIVQSAIYNPNAYIHGTERKRMENPG